jgi:hypothetical protein
MANGNIQKKYKNNQQHGDVCTSCCNICSAHLDKKNEEFVHERQLPYNNRKTTLRHGRGNKYAFHGIERPSCLMLTMVENLWPYLFCMSQPRHEQVD